MDDEVLKMTGREAIKYVSDLHNITSMYAIAKSLSYDDLTVQTVQISNYLNGVKMGKKVADRFFEVYEIIITDFYDGGAIRRNYDSSI